MQHVESIALLAESQAGVLHRRQLRAAGIPLKVERRRVRQGMLVPEGGGVYRLAGVPPSWEQRLWRAVLADRARKAVSHRSAATLHGIGRFGTGAVDVIELDHLGPNAGRESPHRSNHVPVGHLTEVRGLPTTTVPRTVFDLASQVSMKRFRRGLPSLRLSQVERALDDAIAAGHPIASFEGVLAEHGKRGRGGTVVLRSMLFDRGEGFVATESELEDLLVRVLRTNGLELPAPQRNVGGLDDRIGRVDFLYVAEHVVIEVDGRRNHTALLDAEGDRWRDLELTAAGFAVIRVTHAQLVGDPRRFVRNLRALLASRRRSA